MRLVLASNNAKKLAELRELLGALAVELVPQGELGIAEAEEPHDTFIENALAKARHAARAAGGAAIADDSGLCVPALGGEPGVHSAVFAGAVPVASGDREAQRRAQDAANNALLLQRLAAQTGGTGESGKTGETGETGGEAARRAYFACTLVALRHAEDPEPLVATGRWPGTLLSAPRGAGGFGYDPLMFIPSLSCSVAELDADVKNRHSHRALAARQMRELIATVWQP
ncbi:MAG: non-canonical purine NTP pyrophosphatase [Burkholderiales bacterium]|nr:non-canonical purine NTP pyrophosphatase [Burkholderiales bacterium]